MPENIKYNLLSETLERMDQRDISILQNKEGYRFNSDSTLLIAFTINIIRLLPLNKQSRIADLGSGCGILSVLCAKSNLFAKVSAYEIQESLFELTKKNIKLNHVEELIEVFNQDYTSIDNKLELLSYDFIICNPPYTKIGDGKTSKNQEKLIARHEVKTTLETLGNAFNKLLKPTGRVFLVYPVRRLAEFIFYMKSIHLEPKTLQFIFHNKNADSELFLAELVKGGKSSLKVLEPFFQSKEVNFSNLF